MLDNLEKYYVDKYTSKKCFKGKLKQKSAKNGISEHQIRKKIETWKEKYDFDKQFEL